jgi:hypothetical protein
MDDLQREKGHLKLEIDVFQACFGRFNPDCYVSKPDPGPQAAGTKALFLRALHA